MFILQVKSSGLWGGEADSWSDVGSKGRKRADSEESSRSEKSDFDDISEDDFVPNPCESNTFWQGTKLVAGTTATVAAYNAEGSTFATAVNGYGKGIKTAVTSRSLAPLKEAYTAARVASPVGEAKWIAGSTAVKSTLIIGAVLAIANNLFDLIRFGCMSREKGESRKEYGKRCDQAGSDLVINMACTTIFGILGSFLFPGLGTYGGAMLGMTLGNFIGNTFKSNGYGRAIASWFGGQVAKA